MGHREQEVATVGPEEAYNEGTSQSGHEGIAYSFTLLVIILMMVFDLEWIDEE